MSTPKKRLDATIASLAARVEISPHRSRPSSPLVRTPKHSKLKTSVATPSPNRKKAQPCDRSKDLYNRICKGLIDSTRTTPKNKNSTPTKFFKSRSAAATVPAPKNLRKTVPLYFCAEPVEYITDVENINKVGGRTRKRRSVAVEMVMPLYNIKTGVDAHEHVEIVADVVDEIFDESTKGKTKKQKSRLVKVQKAVNPCVSIQPSSSTYKSEEYEPPIYSFEGSVEENTEFNKTAPESLKYSVIKTPAVVSLKRKASTQEETEPSKRRKTVVYNNADSSDEEDAMFISTIKPILSEEENEEMQKILGKTDDTIGIDTATEDVLVRRQRKEGNL